MLCLNCGERKVAYLKLIWCKECATEKENHNG